MALLWGEITNKLLNFAFLAYSSLYTNNIRVPIYYGNSVVSHQRFSCVALLFFQCTSVSRCDEQGQLHGRDCRNVHRVRLHCTSRV